MAVVFFLARVAAEALAAVLDDMAAATSLVFLLGSSGSLVLLGMPGAGSSGLSCLLAYAETARGGSIELVSGNE